MYNRTGIITQYSPVITGEFNVGFLDDNTKWSVIIVLIYESGLEVVSMIQKNTSEYNNIFQIIKNDYIHRYI